MNNQETLLRPRRKAYQSEGPALDETSGADRLDQKNER
jgi:hypothetical protein